MIKKLFISISILLLFPSVLFAAGAFPGCEGYGCNQRGPYSISNTPDIYIVNTTTTSTARSDVSGSRCPADTDYTCGTDYKIYTVGFEAIENYSGAKIVIFDTGGEMQIEQAVFTAPGIYIAGQTAPDPGLWFTKGFIWFYGANYHIVRDIRILPGDDAGSYCEDNPSNCDGITLYTNNSGYSAIDHVSIHFAQDETWNAGSGPDNVTLSNSILAHAVGDHRYGPAVTAYSTMTNISIIKNLMVDLTLRNPALYANGGSLSGIVVNNMMHNWGGLEAGAMNIGSYISSPLDVSFEGNYAKKGDDSVGNTIVSLASGASTSTANTNMYCADNYGSGADTTWTDCDSPADTMIVKYDSQTFTESGTRTPAYPTGDGAITVLSAANTPAYVLANAGAYPAYRASAYYDSLAVTEATNGTGSIQTTVSNYGGWKTMTSNTHDPVLSLPANPHSEAYSGSGYTNLELWLNDYAKIVQNEKPEVENVSPADGDTGVSITADGSLYHSAYVDDVDWLLFKDSCDNVSGTINPDGDEGAVAYGNDDATFSMDFGTMDESSTYCFTVITNYGGSTGDWQEFEFTTTQGINPPTPVGSVQYLKKGPKFEWLKKSRGLQ